MRDWKIFVSLPDPTVLFIGLLLTALTVVTIAWGGEGLGEAAFGLSAGLVLGFGTLAMVFTAQALLKRKTLPPKTVVFNSNILVLFVLLVVIALVNVLWLNPDVFKAMALKGLFAGVTTSGLTVMTALARGTMQNEEE